MATLVLCYYLDGLAGKLSLLVYMIACTGLSSQLALLLWMSFLIPHVLGSPQSAPFPDIGFQDFSDFPLALLWPDEVGACRTVVCSRWELSGRPSLPTPRDRGPCVEPLVLRMVDSGRPCPDVVESLPPLSREPSLGVRPTDWSAPLPARGVPDMKPSVEIEVLWCIDRFVVAVELCYLSTQPRTKARTVSPTGGPNIRPVGVMPKDTKSLASLNHQGIFLF